MNLSNLQTGIAIIGALPCAFLGFRPSDVSEKAKQKRTHSRKNRTVRSQSNREQRRSQNEPDHGPKDMNVAPAPRLLPGNNNRREVFCTRTRNTAKAKMGEVAWAGGRVEWRGVGWWGDAGWGWVGCKTSRSSSSSSSSSRSSSSSSSSSSSRRTVHWSNFGVRRATLKPELELGKQIWSQGWGHKAAQQVF